jgi:hypothetical protein
VKENTLTFIIRGIYSIETVVIPNLNSNEYARCRENLS